MHIPDGALSPLTTIPAFGAMVTIWTISLNKIKKVLSHRQIPMLAMYAAFSFVIMMFNVPVGSSSVHAAGAVLIAVMLGPFAACISITVALLVQAFVFGDGGIIALGINCFNMALVMPFSGYYIYKLISGKSSILSKRSMFGIFMGSYIGINLAAFFTAVEFGIQPFFRAAEGNPLYMPYPLTVTIPALMPGYLLIAGPLEGIMTITAVNYIAKSAPQLLLNSGKDMSGVSIPTNFDGKDKSFFKRYKAVITVLIVLVLLTPLGLLANGTAWGEWNNTWKSILSSYTIPGIKNTAWGYILSAAAGVLLISVIMFTSYKLLSKEQRENKDNIDEKK